VKNVTITLDNKTAADARRLAAAQNLSLSRLIDSLLQQHLKESRRYGEAMRQYLGRTPTPLNAGGSAYPGREELHDRSGLR
jgi:hypothetical protein